MNTTDKPAFQVFHLEGVKHIAPLKAMELLQNKEAVIIDVREETETALESIPLENVLYHPMSVIMDRIPFISKDQQIILVCPGGVRSTKVAHLFNLQGYPNVANLDGGLTMWKAFGLPYDSNLSFAGGCGCGCSTTSSDKKDGACC
jgi:rhodanese-related sulfurtransferase